LIDEAEEHAAQLRTLTDHHYMSVLKNKKGKLTLKAIKERLKTTGDKVEQKTLNKYLEADKEHKTKAKEAKAMLQSVEEHFLKRLDTDPLPEELTDFNVVARYLELLDEQSALKSKAKEAAAALDKLAYEKYPKLTVKEIKTLVVDDKWMTALANAVQGELNRVRRRSPAASSNSRSATRLRSHN